MKTSEKIILNMLSGDAKTISYRPEFSTALGGNPIAAIVLQQIFYLWHRVGERPFYKFKSPCNNGRYVPGDSWEECLGISSKMFDTALKSFAQKLSKGTEKDDKALVYYWINMDRVTYFEINRSAFIDFVVKAYESNDCAVNDESADSKRPNGIYVNDESAFTKTTNRHLDSIQIEQQIKQQREREETPALNFSKNEPSINQPLEETFTTAGPGAGPKLPPEEQRIEDAIANAAAYFREYPAMVDKCREAAKDPDLSKAVIYEQLKAWVRYHGDEFNFLASIGRNIPKSFIPWMQKYQQFKPKQVKQQTQYAIGEKPKEVYRPHERMRQEPLPAAIDTLVTNAAKQLNTNKKAAA